MNINTSDFALEPRGRRSFETWVSKTKLSSELGELSLELLTPMASEPTEQMRDTLRALAEFVRRDSALVLDLVFAGYQHTKSNDPSWLAECGVPTTLTRAQVMEFVDSDRTLCVARFDEKDELVAKINLTPRWDQEHAFQITVANSQVHAINDSPTILKRLLATITAAQ